LALYPKLGENKIFELFNAAHYQWIGMYIGIEIENFDEISSSFFIR
jgi:hypothetical protein